MIPNCSTTCPLVISPSTITNNTKTVMICEDERDLLLTYAAMLKMEYSVIETSSGNECLETYIRKKKNGQTIHVILLDYKLGDISGDEVAKAIMALNGTRIILISAYEIDPEVINELMKNKIIVNFLTKPVSHNLLKEAVKRAVINSRTTSS